MITELLGPHLNWLRLKQAYDNVPILINQGIAFKRYEVVMDYIGLGATAALDFEYYYSTDNFAIESFGLNPFMMPDGRMVSENLYSPNHFKVYLGFSTYF
ncbi:MAG: hypothetical protein PF693_06935 [Spirochaetia bacterium]|jgi:hypothetical protein|nr:hypothetical protein [Spirochaetia bacterium]